MSRRREYRRLMEGIRDAHAAFKRDWAERRSAALKGLVADERAASWEEIWRANGVAYRGAASLAERRDRLLGELFERHLIPLYEKFRQGDADAVNGVIDFLEVDVLAFRCGYVKESYLRELKRVHLDEGHRERLRRYGLNLCGTASHRREIREAGGLMIAMADREMVERLMVLIGGGNERVMKKAGKMLGVILNARSDLR